MNEKKNIQAFVNEINIRRILSFYLTVKLRKCLFILFEHNKQNKCQIGIPHDVYYSTIDPHGFTCLHNNP